MSTLLCGAEVTYNGTAIGQLQGLTGLGASRAAVRTVHNDVPDNWAQYLYSCIADPKPFRISCVSNHSASWIASIQAAKANLVITFPPLEGDTTGLVVTWPGALVDYAEGAPDLESRIDCSFTFQPSGKPTFVAGS